MLITTYVHGSKETNYQQAEEAGIYDEKILRKFSYAGYELKLIYNVNEHNGDMQLLEIWDGKTRYVISHSVTEE